MLVPLRTKTEREFERDLEMFVVMDMMERVCRQEPEDAERIVWMLTYNPQEALRRFSAFGKEKAEKLTQEQITVLREECISQYRAIDSEFMRNWNFNQPPYSTQEPFVALCKAVHGDMIIFYEVIKHVESYSDSKAEVRRTAWLLRSDNHRHKFGGLRRLGFGHSEAIFLKRYAKQISKVLEKMKGIESKN